MSDKPLESRLTYFGISPWEIEVVYGFLNSRFKVIQNEIEKEEDSELASMLNMDIPLPFNEEFFKWFEYSRWEKIKFLFKEMRRRRGNKHALKIQINFAGTPKISFVVDSIDKQWYEKSVEKIDFVLELLPYHLEPEKLPNNVTSVIYYFDSEHARWRLKTAYSDQKKFELKNNSWKLVT
ncbi:MAG TPA: hypothetical protein VLC72_06285 [Nitrosopumilaceae archaeon]|nr:hypothetical protein [Nitrosopumilaceae archaeon]